MKEIERTLQPILETEMITKEQVSGKWNAIVRSVKEKFNQITGDELNRVQGDTSELIALVQRKSGQSREWVEAFLANIGESTENAVERISSTASQFASNASAAISENYDHLADGAHRGYDYTRKTVSRRPFESIAIALGAGVLTGLIVGLSMASKRRLS
jgi:ElaB/YqjD/DUF883 family membrane-anchored ribosome-binding protein